MSQRPLSDLCRCIFPTPETGSAAAVASTTHAPDSAADKRSASYSPVHRLHLASSSPAAGGHAAGSTPEELQSVSAVAADTHSDAELQPATAERWVAAETAEPEAPAAAGVEASGEAAAAALGLAGDPVTVRDGQQGAAWAEQPVCSTAGSLEDSAFVGHDLTPGYPRLNHEIRGDPVPGSARQDAAVATAGSLEDSAFVGHDLGVSISAGQDAEVATAAGQRQGRFRVPWLMARGGSKAAKVCRILLWHHRSVPGLNMTGCLLGFRLWVGSMPLYTLLLLYVDTGGCSRLWMPLCAVRHMQQ